MGWFCFKNDSDSEEQISLQSLIKIISYCGMWKNEEEICKIITYSDVRRTNTWII